MIDPTRAFPEVPQELEQLLRKPACCKCGDVCEEIVRPGYGMYYTGLCRLHGDLEFSERWQKNWKAAKADVDQQSRLLKQRRSWEDVGHVYRGTSEQDRSGR